MNYRSNENLQIVLDTSGYQLRKGMMYEGRVIKSSRGNRAIHEHTLYCDGVLLINRNEASPHNGSRISWGHCGEEAMHLAFVILAHHTRDQG